MIPRPDSLANGEVAYEHSPNWELATAPPTAEPYQGVG